MLQLLTQSAWADRIGWVLVHSLWQFALLGLAAIILRRALQRCSAGFGGSPGGNRPRALWEAAAS